MRQFLINIQVRLMFPFKYWKNVRNAFIEKDLSPFDSCGRNLILYAHHINEYIFFVHLNSSNSISLKKLDGSIARERSLQFQQLQKGLYSLLSFTEQI